MERWLITGATGLVGAALCERAGAAGGVEIYRASLGGGGNSRRADLGKRGAISSLLNDLRPHRVFHLAAVARPAQVALDLEAARKVNVLGSAEVVQWCARNNRWILFASTDQVFDGECGPYSEGDVAEPITEYGQMKLMTERLVLAAGGTVARLGWVLNDMSTGRPDFLGMSMARLRQGYPVKAVVDEQRTPVKLSYAVEILRQLAANDHSGLIHVAGSEHVTPHDLIKKEAAAAGLSVDLVRRVARATLAPRNRPRDLRLNTSLLSSMFFVNPEEFASAAF